MSSKQNKSVTVSTTANNTQQTAVKYTASTLLLAVANKQLTPENAAAILPKVCTSAYNYTKSNVLFRHAKWVGKNKKYAAITDELLAAAESILKYVPQQPTKKST